MCLTKVFFVAKVTRLILRQKRSVVLIKHTVLSRHVKIDFYLFAKAMLLFPLTSGETLQSGKCRNHVQKAIYLFFLFYNDFLA